MTNHLTTANFLLQICVQPTSINENGKYKRQITIAINNMDMYGHRLDQWLAKIYLHTNKMEGGYEKLVYPLYLLIVGVVIRMKTKHRKKATTSRLANNKQWMVEPMLIIINTIVLCDISHRVVEIARGQNRTKKNCPLFRWIIAKKRRMHWINNSNSMEFN